MAIEELTETCTFEVKFEKTQLCIFNPIMPRVLYIGRLANILISSKDGILKKNSYELREYESVDAKSLS